MFSSHKSFAVIGLGAYGVALARALTEGGGRVLGIDRNQTLVDRYHAEFDSTICADVTDLRALRECAIDDQDMVIMAIGSNVKSSLVGARNCLKLGAKAMRAKAQSEAQEDILRALGIGEIDRPEIDAGARIAEALLGSAAD